MRNLMIQGTTSSAGIIPNLDMNPILLMPKSNVCSEVVLCGEETGEVDASTYFIALTNIPVVGVIPYVELGLVDEDSLVERDKRCNHKEQNTIEEEEELSKLARTVRENLDMDYIYKLVGDING